MTITRSIYVGLFCLSAAVLTLEITLTRIFSVLLWGHYSFLVISTALLGFGAAGSYLALWPRARTEEQGRRFLARNCLLFAFTLVISVMICTRLGYQPTRTFKSTYHTLMLPAMYSILVVPFCFAGLAIGFLLSSFAKQINAVYFSDLAGAGVGALAVTFLLGQAGAPTALLIAAVLAVASGLFFLGPLRRWTSYGWLGAFAAVLAFVSVADPWNIPVPRGKALFAHQDEIEDTYWSLLARIDVLGDEERTLNFGCGTAKEYFDRPVSFVPFFMDGSNPSRMIKYDQDLWFLPKLLSATPYSLGFDSPEVLIIGSGGGIDTLVALHYEASHVTAVEINPKTVELVKGRYADYIGGIFDRPDVTLLAVEGRHFLTLSDDSYDVIRLTGVDTRAASAIGANAKDHAYIYTVEAIRDLFEHLNDGGVLAITRANTWKVKRLLNVILTSLEGMGVERPADHLAVVHNDSWADVVVSKNPLPSERVDALVDWADESHMTVVYEPFRPRPREQDGRLIRMSSEDRERYCADFRYDLSPVTDDSPFFFEPTTLGGFLSGLSENKKSKTSTSGYSTLLLALGGAAGLSLLLVLLPLLGLRSQSSGKQSRTWSLLYFSMLGLGFILAELIFVQKYMIFLGGPIYSLSVTLFSILVFSGLGAYCAKQIDLGSRAARIGLILTLVTVLLLTNAFLRWGMPQLLGLPFAVRVMLGIASLAPVSFLMGMPFPVGISILERTAPGLIAWAWGTNACLTVIGSVLSVIISMNWGFYTAMMVAIVCYAVAGVCLLGMRVEESQTAPLPSSG